MQLSVPKLMESGEEKKSGVFSQSTVLSQQSAVGSRQSTVSSRQLAVGQSNSLSVGSHLSCGKFVVCSSAYSYTHNS
jgi:hypothetical protein